MRAVTAGHDPARRRRRLVVFCGGRLRRQPDRSDHLVAAATRHPPAPGGWRHRPLQAPAAMRPWCPRNGRRSPSTSAANRPRPAHRRRRQPPKAVTGAVGPGADAAFRVCRWRQRRGDLLGRLGRGCPVTSKIPQHMPLTCKEESALSIFGRQKSGLTVSPTAAAPVVTTKFAHWEAWPTASGRLSSCVNVSVSSLSVQPEED